MKKMILASIVTLLATFAMADIPPMGGEPTKEVPISESKISGKAAETVYESISGDGKMEASLRTMSVSYKVLRSKDGLDQVICHKTSVRMGRQKTSYECEAQSSNTEEVLKVYKPAIKMG